MATPVKDNYLLDVGDYVKFALLRALIAPNSDPARLTDSPPMRRLGVVWYRTVHDEGNNDGMRLSHLHRDGWEALDPALLTELRALKRRIDAGEPRVLELLDDSPALPGATYASEPLPTRVAEGIGRHHQKARRLKERPEWWARALSRVTDCDVVFADPDNGLMPTRREPGAKDEDKSMRYGELADLVEPTPAAPARVAVVYHHLDRTKGGWPAALETIKGRLRAHDIEEALVGHLLASVGSGRAFFLLTRSEGERRRCEDAIGGMLERAQGARELAGKLSWTPAGAVPPRPARGRAPTQARRATSPMAPVAAEDSLDLDRRLAGLPAAHPARCHARAFALALGLEEDARQPELLQSAAWHFAAHALAADPQSLRVSRSGHNDGMHSDLVVRSADWTRMVAYTWTSGAWSHGNGPSLSYVDAFLLKRHVEERRLVRRLGGENPDPSAPAVTAALTMRAATDPSLGWSADIEGGEHGDPETSEWRLGPTDGAALLTVDVARGIVSGPGGSVPASEFAGRLDDPLKGLGETHRRLCTLAKRPPGVVTNRAGT